MKKLKNDDYLIWAGENSWTYHETALLFHGFEPHSCQDLYTLLIHELPLPPKVKVIRKTFVAIFGILHRESDDPSKVNNARFHPFMIIKEIYKRGVIPFDKNPILLDLLNQRHLREIGRELIQKPAMDSRIQQKEPVKPKDETLHNIIGALAILYWEKRSANNPSKINQSSIIQEIMNRFPDVSGLKQRTLEGYLSVALKAINKN